MLGNVLLEFETDESVHESDLRNFNGLILAVCVSLDETVPSVRGTVYQLRTLFKRCPARQAIQRLARENRPVTWCQTMKRYGNDQISPTGVSAASFEENHEVP